MSTSPQEVERAFGWTAVVLIGLLALGPGVLQGVKFAAESSAEAEPDQVMTYVLADGHMIAMPTTEARCRYLRDGLVSGAHALKTTPPWGGPSIDIVGVACGFEKPRRRKQRGEIGL